MNLALWMKKCGELEIELKHRNKLFDAATLVISKQMDEINQLTEEIKKIRKELDSLRRSDG
jgi:hypothetical protein